MKNFNWTMFTRRIAVKSDISTIYAAWTKSSEIEKWFLSNADYFDTKNKLADRNKHIQKNYTYEWSWYLWEGIEKGKITDANGMDFLQFTFADKCIVEIKLSKSGDFTIVELVQDNIPTDDDSKVNVRLGCHTGWSFYMVNLKSVYEGGLDLRNKNTNLTGMINS